MLALAWSVLALEIIGSVFFAFVFWHFWTHSAMKREIVVRALVVYVIGCGVCVILTFFTPL